MNKTIESIEGLIEVKVLIPFKTESEAKIAFNCLRIDSEINSNKRFVYKNICFDKNYLKINLKSNQLKQIRVSLKSVLQSLDLLIETMDSFAIEDN